MLHYDPMPHTAWFSDLLGDPEERHHCTYAMAPPIRPPAPFQGCSGSIPAPCRPPLSNVPPVLLPTPIQGHSGSHLAPCRPTSPLHPPVLPSVPIQGCSRVAELVQCSFMAAPRLAPSAAPTHAHGAAPVSICVTHSAPAPPTAIAHDLPLPTPTRVV